MGQDERYRSAIGEFGAALQRLAKSYERDPDLVHDLVQDIHFALWRSFSTYEGQCSLRTWVYRVAHNTAVSQRLRRRGREPDLVSLADIVEPRSAQDIETVIGDAQALARLQSLILTLKAPDNQVMQLYLEDLGASEIADITGLSPGAVATRIHRIKTLLARQFGDRS